MNSAIICRSLDHDIWDHPGQIVKMKYSLRKYRDRPSLKVGQEVTIVRFTRVDGQYGPMPRLLVRTSDSFERWIAASSVDI